MKEKIKIEIEIGHWAKRLSAAPVQPVLPNSAVQNATHVWKVWVCGRKGQLESFVQRAVFRLHPSFPTPVIVVTEPPFEIEEKAFGTFPMKIELHFNDSMAAFDYEVFLMLDRDINCKAIKSFSIANPKPPEFREKLILAGGVVVDSSDEASGPSESQAPAPKVHKSLKSHGSSGSLARHKSKTKTAASTGSGGLQFDDMQFASPASSEDLAAQVLSPPQPHLSQQVPALTAMVAQPSVATTLKTVGSRLASPSKAMLKEPSGYGLPRSEHRSPAKPRPPPPPSAATAAIVKAEPVTFGVGSPAQPASYAEPSPRVTELRADEQPKSEKLVLKITKSPVKSSPVAAVKTEPVVIAADASGQHRPPQPAMVAVVAPTHSVAPPPQTTLPQHPPTMSGPPLSVPQPPLAVSAPMETFVEAPTQLPHPQAVQVMPAAEAVVVVEPPIPAHPTVPEGFASASEDDRRKRKKEKRKKDKDRHRHRRRSHGSGGGADTDSDERRNERKRRRHEAKEKKKKEAGVAAAAVAASSAASMDSGLDEDAAVVPQPQVPNPQLAQPPAPVPPEAPPPPPPPQQPPPTLEAEPPMLSPYLMSAGPKEDPELMSQASVESTGFRPPTADGGSEGSSPVASVGIPVSAAAMAAESAAAAVAAATAAETTATSAYAKHPKYQWTADLGLSRAEYDQRFQLCLLAASLEDPGRLERLASVLSASGALTARDAEYAHFDLARLGPDCVRQLRALLMPDSAS